MGVDWRQRESLLSKMKVALRRILTRFGVPSQEAKLSAEHIVSWLRIQTAPDVEQVTEVGGE
jgi:hypothetical protein